MYVPRDYITAVDNNIKHKARQATTCSYACQAHTGIDWKISPKPRYIASVFAKSQPNMLRKEWWLGRTKTVA